MRSSVLVTALAGFAAAETGHDAWLRYARLNFPFQYNAPSTIVALNSTITSPVYTAGIELQNGIQGIIGSSCSVGHGGSSNPWGDWSGWGGFRFGSWPWSRSVQVIIGTVDEYTKAYGPLASPPMLVEDGFWLNTTGNTIQILGQNERGALYGAFEYLSMLARGNFSQVAYANNPAAPIRWTNEVGHLSLNTRH